MSMDGRDPNNRPVGRQSLSRAASAIRSHSELARDAALAQAQGRGVDTRQPQPTASSQSTAPSQPPASPRAAAREQSSPTREPAPTPLSPHEVHQHYGGQLRETAGAASMYASMCGFLGHFEAGAFKAYRDQLLAEVGNPADPIEIMIIEQIALAHLNIGRLQFRSSTAETLDGAKIYGSMATQLMGEFRRTALALQAFRFAGARNVPAVVVDERRAPNTPGALYQREDGWTQTADDRSCTETVDSELVTNEVSDESKLIVRFPAEQEPEAGRGGQTQPGEAARAHA